MFSSFSHCGVFREVQWGELGEFQELKKGCGWGAESQGRGMGWEEP